MPQRHTRETRKEIRKERMIAASVDITPVPQKNKLFGKLFPTPDTYEEATRLKESALESGEYSKVKVVYQGEKKEFRYRVNVYKSIERKEDTKEKKKKSKGNKKKK